MTDNLPAESSEAGPGSRVLWTHPRSAHTDDELIMLVRRAPMFDAGSDEWFLRLARTVEKNVLEAVEVPT